MRPALTALEHGIRLSAASIPAGGTSYLVAGGFLPGHPVRMSIDGRAIATITASNLGTVTYMIDPSLLRLAAGQHVVRLGSMLITMTGPSAATNARAPHWPRPHAGRGQAPADG